MRIKLDEIIKLEKKDLWYIVVSYHRNSSLPTKAKWTIPRIKEFQCFINSEEKEWLINDEGWGLIANGNKLMELGKNPQSESLFMSKFIDSNKNNTWHGYPADYRRKIQDIPSTSILKKWYNEGLIEKHQILKIKKGKKCNL